MARDENEFDTPGLESLTLTLHFDLVFYDQSNVSNALSEANSNTQF